MNTPCYAYPSIVNENLCCFLTSLSCRWCCFLSLVRKCVHFQWEYTKEQNYWIIAYACSQLQLVWKTKVSHSCCSSLRSNHKYMRVVVSPNLCQNVKIIVHFSHLDGCEVYFYSDFHFYSSSKWGWVTFQVSLGLLSILCVLLFLFCPFSCVSPLFSY